MMKLAVAITTPEIVRPVPVALLSGSFSERVKKVAELGCEGLELFVVRPCEIDASLICQELAEAELRVAAVGTGAIALMDKLTLLSSDAAVRQRAVARLDELIDFSAAIGSPLVTIGGFRGFYRDVGGKPGRDMLAEILCSASEKSAEKGVRLVIEPLNRYESDAINNVREGLELIDRVGHRSLGLLLDTFHMNIEEASLPNALRLACERDRLWHVHLGDSNRLPPGMGHIDFQEITKTLHDLGYESYLSAELLPRPNPDEAALLTVRHMRQFVPAIVHSKLRGGTTQ